MGSTTSGALLFRAALGEVLRAERMRRGLTLRQLSAQARVSLGYISEIERGQKEASSELLAALCAALDCPLSEVLREVSDRVELAEIVDQVRESVTGAAALGAGIGADLEAGVDLGLDSDGDVVVAA